MRRWIGFACAAVVLCAAAWYFGRPTVQPISPTPVVAETPPPEAPRELPPKVIEVIDLARAYEPVREPEPVLPGGVDPARFIEEPSAPRRIPPAFDEENPYVDVIRTVQESEGSIRERMELMPRVVPGHRPSGIEGAPLQNLLHIPDFPYPVQLDVMPREIDASLDQIRELSGRIDDAPTVVLNGELRFVPMGVPYWDKTSAKPLDATYRELIALWMQIAELYGSIGVESER